MKPQMRRKALCLRKHKKRALGGRPTKLTPHVQAVVIRAIRAGNYRQVAAEWAGIGAETMSRWMSREREPYIGFRQAVLEAERAAEIRAVRRIMRAAVKDPKVARTEVS